MIKHGPRLFFALTLTIAIFFGLASPRAQAEPVVAAEAALLMNLDTGQVLWARNEKGRLAPASTTKILTALVALERSKLDEMVTVSEAAAAAEGSSAYFHAGEQVSMQDMLYALMLRSGNDAAVAIAEHVAGSVDAFAKLMNETARRVGAADSNFVNPHGLPADNQYTTAADLAVITRAAMANPAFREIVATRTRPWRSKEWEGLLVNHNKLLGTYEGAIGVKTGYTTEAGQCLVAAARRGDDAYLAVVLNSQGSAVWDDARTLLDEGFKNFTTLDLVAAGEKAATVTVNGVEVPLLATGPVRYAVARAKPGSFQRDVVLGELRLPMVQGSRLGELVVRDDNREIARVGLEAAVNVPAPRSPWPAVRWAGWVLVALWLLARLDAARRRRRRNRYGFGRSRSIRF